MSLYDSSKDKSDKGRMWLEEVTAWWYPETATPDTIMVHTCVGPCALRTTRSISDYTRVNVINGARRMVENLKHVETVVGAVFFGASDIVWTVRVYRIMYTVWLLPCFKFNFKSRHGHEYQPDDIAPVEFFPSRSKIQYTTAEFNRCYNKMCNIIITRAWISMHFHYIFFSECLKWCFPSYKSINVFQVHSLLSGKYFLFFK